MSRPDLHAAVVPRRGRRWSLGPLPVTVAAAALAIAAGILGGVAVKAAVSAPGAPWWHGPEQRYEDPLRTDFSGEPAPSRLRIVRIGVDSPLEELHLDAAGALGTPREYAHAGWYADGTRPGEPGPAVIAGHVDSRTGPAVFSRLPELKPGDLIEVERGQVWLPFRVTSAEWYPKSRFPTALVYGPTPDAQLRLITCGGEFDQGRRSYLDNLVVFAVGG